MKGFKFKTKKVVQDIDLLKYKDFDEVLQKHQTISKSYKSTWKVWGASGFAIMFGFIIFTLLTKKENIINPNQLLVQKNIKQLDKIKPVSIKTVQPTEVNYKANHQSQSQSQVVYKVKNIPHYEEKKINKIIKTVAHNDTAISAKIKKIRMEDFFNLQQKTAEERVKLPILFVAGKPWPTMITKRELIKKPTMTIQHQRINKETQIISYTMMLVDPKNYKKKQDKILNLKGKYSAKILREAHRSSIGDFIIYENIIVFIPGIGRMNLGDLKVEIVDDKIYSKRLRERKLIQN